MIRPLPATIARRAAAGWLCLTVVASGDFALGQFTLDGDFDHGSLDEPNTSVIGQTVMLSGRDNYNTGEWKWLYFSADNSLGQRPTFQIGDNFAGGGGNLDGHAMVYSYDHQVWRFFDNNDRDPRRRVFSFSNDTPFTQDQVFVAYGLPYSYERVVTHTAQVTASPWVTPTPSGDDQLVIGQSPGGVDDLGRVVEPLDLYGYKITDPSALGPKMKVALLSGVHANESLANHTLEGLVDFLLSNDPEAAQFRQRAEFYVYPMANPDGRYAGYNRSTIENEALDPNRYWVSPDYAGMTDIATVAEALLADTGAEVDYFIDLHSTVDGKDGHFGYVHPDFQGDPFYQTLLGLEPGMNTRDEDFADSTAQKFGLAELGAGFTMTFETQFLAGENVERFHDLGESIGLSLARSGRVAGDLNSDNVLDALDWLQLIANAETDLSGLSAEEAYAAGDLDGDGVNSLADFAIFKSVFVGAKGPAAFDGLLTTSLPEPSSLLLAITAMHAKVKGRRRG